MKVFCGIVQTLKNCIPDKIFLKIQYYRYFSRQLCLKKPELFSDKMFWLKLYDRKEIYHIFVDKINCKKYLENLLGKNYCVPTLGIYNCFEEIKWEALPESFVLKATHDSGSYYIVKDKRKLDLRDCKNHLYLHWKKDYYKYNREWQYKGLESRIIAEPLLAEPKDLREYKFFCFNGEPKIYQTCYDRDNSLGGAVLNFYDLDGKHLDMHDAGHARLSDKELPPPKNMNKMLELCRIISKDTYFLRVDFF